MKHIFFFLLLCIALSACKQSSPKDIVNEETEVISADTPAVSSNSDTTTVKKENSSTIPNTSTSSIKVCNPNFNLLGKPAKNQHVYYVSGFNPGEFKCWALIEKHGVGICGDVPCTIYYVDKPDIKLTQTGPHYIDEGTLSTAGIGRFVFDGHFWEIKGSRLWKRNERVYGYYNTNNHLGG
jgi:hypothetical protein